jgi:hypothetical protein
VRLAKGRLSGFGTDVLTRVDELEEACPWVEDDTALRDLAQLGKLISGRWKAITHGERLITGEDRLVTEAFLQNAKKLVILAETKDAPGTDSEALSMLRADLEIEAQHFKAGIRPPDPRLERARRQARENLPSRASADDGENVRHLFCSQDRGPALGLMRRVVAEEYIHGAAISERCPAFSACAQLAADLVPI